MNQVRILQAVGIGVLSLLLGGMVIQYIWRTQGITPPQLTTDPQLMMHLMLTYILPFEVLVQLIMGFWLGRKVGGNWISLLGHVYLSNLVLFLIIVILGYLVGQNAFWLAAFTPIVALLLSIPSFPMALLVRRK